MTYCEAFHEAASLRCLYKATKVVEERIHQYGWFVQIDLCEQHYDEFVKVMLTHPTIGLQ